MATQLALVSILIPLFNSEKYIRKALESVAFQTYSNIEVVIVDDFSNDTSVAIVENFFIEHAHIAHSISHNVKNEGVSFTRNELVDNAKGDFICFLDSDDYFEHDAISYLINIVVNNNTDIGQCLYYSETPEGVQTGTVNKFSPNRTLRGKEAVFSMLDNEITGFLWHKIFKRNLFRNVSFDAKLPVFEDYLVIMKMFINGADISFGSEPKYHYIQHNSSLTKMSYRKALDRMQYLEITKSLVNPLIISGSDELKIIKHEYIVSLMVFINAIKFGAPKNEVKEIEKHINVSYLLRLKSQLNYKKFYSILMIKISPALLFFAFKTIFKIKK
ncbi:glycosyltransferase family 2 protein [Rahnella woolbedingensis]|uniref:Glycosyltransferase family 2 protein n=1 Tax=Rahnella woolbedingensis TaxID=1510574 RepID=A0A419N5M6_9GAMM|nr:glycosyltransferase family 2 protein [Rahnella woolbedingensis]RJT41605.1 glycosyltransferase family 2 protein [Rahnella woolbedingensis]